VLSINPAAKGMARSGIREIMNAVWGRPDVTGRLAIDQSPSVRPMVLNRT